MKIRQFWSAGGLTTLAALAVVPFARPLITQNEAGAVRDLTVGSDTVRIVVALREFAFVPDTIRVPAGQPVTLVIKNVGQVEHEFMAGRKVHDGGFAQDLFADVHVNTTSAMGAMGEGAMAEGHGHAGGGHGDKEEKEEEEGEHGGDDHGTMVMPAAGKTLTMSFTLPESRRGVWSIGCFLPGHYEAGMRGTLIVE